MLELPFSSVEATREFWRWVAIAAMAGMIVAVLLCNPSRAIAHDAWKNGDPVPAWIKNQCCGVADAHHYTPDEVTTDHDGYHFRGFYKTVGYKEVLPSPDGEYWVFWRQLEGRQTDAYCAFVPEPGM